MCISNLKVFFFISSLLCFLSCNDYKECIEFDKTFKTFQEALRDKDATKLNQMSCDLVFIRNFVSGTYGARGSNMHFCLKKIPKKLTISIPKETSMQIDSLFLPVINSPIKKFIKVHKSINIYDKYYIKQSSPSTEEIIDTLAYILKEAKLTSENPVLIYLDSDEVLLALIDSHKLCTTSQGCTGTYALFEHQKLRAIFDLR